MGKKVVISLFIIVIALSYFFYKSRGFIRGVKPVIAPPSEDISELIPVDMPLQLPEGFSISIFAKDLKKPRVLLRDPAGTLLVSITKENRVVALPDKDNDGVADRIVAVKENLNRPHGLAFQEGRLYIAETDQVAVYDYDPETFKVSNKQKLVDLPGGGNHFTRTLLFNPSDPNELLISAGSTCNVCNEEDWRRAKILVYNLETEVLETFASGLRNAVFMAEHPITKEVWATEMGRDWLGDNLPPDEINIIEEDKNYGWPICYGKNVFDTDFHKDDHVHIRAHCTEPFEIPSYIDIPAHSSPLGLAFFSKEGWPKEYQNDLLVSYHGSWNRTVPTGYKIVRFSLDREGRVLSVEDFITGWLQDDGTALGRPVDILIEPDGVIYISDDKAGVIYRVAHQKSTKNTKTQKQNCIVTGCSGQVCADEDVITTCEFLPEYMCYRDARCERQSDGECGWTETPELLGCLEAVN